MKKTRDLKALTQAVPEKEENRVRIVYAICEPVDLMVHLLYNLLWNNLARL